MDIGRAVSERLARDPGMLWLAMELAEARVSDTCELERSRVSLARFLPACAESWLRFARVSAAAGERDSADPLAHEYVRAQGWRWRGVFEALEEKQPGFEAAVAKAWGDAWAKESPQSRREEILALGEREREALGKGALNALAHRAQLLLQGVGSAGDLNLAWALDELGAGAQLTERYGPGGPAESWGRVMATLLDHHFDYGKTPHWAGAGLLEALAGPGYGEDERARELAVKGFDEAMAGLVTNERYQALVNRALEPALPRLEQLRLGLALPDPAGLPKGRGPRKA